MWWGVGGSCERTYMYVYHLNLLCSVFNVFATSIFIKMIIEFPIYLNPIRIAF